MTDTKPDPAGGWSEAVVTLKNALVVPPTESDFVQPGGVLDSTGAYCAHSALWRGHRRILDEPAQPEGPIEKLPGRWLYAGLFWSHFGHFLTESTSRLWALDHAGGPIDGLIFVPKRPNRGETLHGYQQAFFDLMGVDVPVRVTLDPLEVEELVVPGQGFGLGDISAGTEKFRACVKSRFAHDVAPDGPEKLYISRSQLGYSRGSILGEPILEQKLAAEGYEIYHPQSHSMVEQVARYKAARKVVATDGSALHLLAMVGNPGQDVAIVARRQSGAVDLLVKHVAMFCEKDPDLMLALRRSWFPAGGKRLKRQSLGELDMPQIGAMLAEKGYITGAEDWPSMTDDEVQEVLKGTGKEWELPRWAIRKARQERRRAKAQAEEQAARSTQSDGKQESDQPQPARRAS